MFKRREKRSFGQTLRETLWPRKGFLRGIGYIGRRIQRLPDSPERIARGIAIGVAASFSPVIGLHLFVALGLAKLMRANLLAAAIGQSFGNPFTALPIIAGALNLGYAILGSRPKEGVIAAVPDLFMLAAQQLWQNFMALFSPATAHWDELIEFWHMVFFPFLIGGVVLGPIFGVLTYVLTLPLVRAYQNMRHKRLQARQATLALDTDKQQDTLNG
ncbi:hypothetical protein BVG79_00419 [Ketogulonicigenium robustum]|uniref:DUF2062 domain-containing protein n=1 Tax=Ketogulonicigenium robustum TaxID=92947 RepID=A0A1W6NX90_9RHOB|nr:DUF2062 domain-containing protein [Ketogulonicigenium robustum]ARO13773.1 hypothetical protein BVG79_00419 [Ketogulonicigenium robustum]